MANTRQRLVAAKLRETGGNISKARELAGYKNPKNTEQTTNSKAWPALLEEFLPESLLTKKHNELINSERDDVALRSVELGYKVRGKLKADDNGGGQGSTTVNFNFANTDPGRLIEIIQAGLGDAGSGSAGATSAEGS